MTAQGLRCITTAAVVGAFAEPDPRPTISDFELYGACRTYETPTCPPNDMGTSAAFTETNECFCSAECFEDQDCPAPPSGYGRAVCLHDVGTTITAYAGYCSLTCADATGSFPCPPGLTCRAPPPTSCTPFYYRPSTDVSVCRGGYYRHGNGDGTIDPGELYGVGRSAGPMCDPNLGWSSAGEGRCVDSFQCCSDADCPAPPPNYPSPVCAWDEECYISCLSDADCQPGGFRCTDLNNGAPGTKPLLGCN